MTGAEVLNVAEEAIWVLLQVAGPPLIVALLVGLGIALFQALTQIQEMTLTFVPKIVAIFFSMLIFLPFMGQTLGAFMERIGSHIAGM